LSRFFYFKSKYIWKRRN